MHRSHAHSPFAMHLPSLPKSSIHFVNPHPAFQDSQTHHQSSDCVSQTQVCGSEAGLNAYVHTPRLDCSLKATSSSFSTRPYPTNSDVSRVFTLMSVSATGFALDMPNAVPSSHIRKRSASPRHLSAQGCNRSAYRDLTKQSPILHPQHFKYPLYLLSEEFRKFRLFHWLGDVGPHVVITSLRHITSVRIYLVAGMEIFKRGS
ncbi:hypothetical protein BKA63DRAFT_23639 [Paraphoma chrysanthemicola]|nr:hypothetical protein BKA63DRAFT_23639 [Paraphoma chrysanthemicola]